MGTTTYTGAVRSENGFSDISKNSDTGAVTTNSTYSNNASVGGTLAVTQSITGKKSINTDFNASSALTQTLTAAQSGTLFLIDGTANNVVNMPALSTENVGVHYEFQLTVAVGGSTTTTFVLPGSAVSAFQGMVSLVAGTAANAVSDVAGDTLTLVNSTVLNARVSMTCVSDDGTNSKWMTTVLSTPIATIA
jgi:hypothetical protein|tara:strand:+ start:266 stop:841 length:576 start_codon:yes stop_codon:yes gene_type:complete